MCYLNKTKTDFIFKGYTHEDTSKEEHIKEISRPSSERALLQHATVAVCEDHIEQEIEADCAEIKETCH